MVVRTASPVLESFARHTRRLGIYPIVEHNCQLFLHRYTPKRASDPIRHVNHGFGVVEILRNEFQRGLLQGGTGHDTDWWNGWIDQGQFPHQTDERGESFPNGMTDGFTLY